MIFWREGREDLRSARMRLVVAIIMMALAIAQSTILAETPLMTVRQRVCESKWSAAEPIRSCVCMWYLSVRWQRPPWVVVKSRGSRLLLLLLRGCRI